MCGPGMSSVYPAPAGTSPRFRTPAARSLGLGAWIIVIGLMQAELQYGDLHRLRLRPYSSGTGAASRVPEAAQACRFGRV